MVEQLSPILFRNGSYVYYRCPGCNTVHSVPVNTGVHPQWTWNGDAVKPTLSPSVRHFTPASERKDNQGNVIESKPAQTYCHYFVKEGCIDYQNDCTHRLNGMQRVPMEPLPSPDVYGYGD